MKKPLCVYTTGLDQLNEQLAQKMLNSLYKTNPKIKEVADIRFFKQKDALERGFTFINDLKMRYMTPIFNQELLKEYECVVRLDADMIITGDISSCWEGDFDVGVVQNANPREIIAQQQMMGKVVQVWDIDPLDYVNCGFVVVKSERFNDHWLKLCTPQRQHYQFYEQDFLNILVFYGDYNVKFLDRQPDNKWWGLISKGYWSQIELKRILTMVKNADGQPKMTDGKITAAGKPYLILPKNSGDERDPWPTDNDKEIVCLHVAGGANAPKFTDIDIRFSEPVAAYLKQLIDETPRNN